VTIGNDSIMKVGQRDKVCGTCSWKYTLEAWRLNSEVPCDTIAFFFSLFQGKKVGIISLYHMKVALQNCWIYDFLSRW
jgi:hypothetical protein